MAENVRAYRFLGTEYYSPKELARALLEHPLDADSHVRAAFLADWLGQDVRDTDMAVRVRQLQQRTDLPSGSLAILAALALGQKEFVRFGCVELSVEGLRTAALVARAEDGASELSDLNVLRDAVGPAWTQLSGVRFPAKDVIRSWREYASRFLVAWNDSVTGEFRARLAPYARVRDTVPPAGAASSCLLIALEHPAADRIIGTVDLWFRDGVFATSGNSRDAFWAVDSSRRIMAAVGYHCEEVVKPHRDQHEAEASRQARVIARAEELAKAGSSKEALRWIREELSDPRFFVFYSKVGVAGLPVWMATLALMHNPDRDVARSILAFVVGLIPKDRRATQALAPLRDKLVQNGTVEQLRVAIDAGMSFDDGEDAVRQPLHTAVAMRRPHEVVAELLRTQGVRVDARDDDGMTPLLLAALYADEPEVARSLIGAGADPNATVKPKHFRDVNAPGNSRNLKGASALWLAREVNPNKGVAAVLEGSRAEDAPPFSVRVELEKAERRAARRRREARERALGLAIGAGTFTLGLEWPALWIGPAFFTLNFIVGSGLGVDFGVITRAYAAFTLAFGSGLILYVLYRLLST